jgi:hypothetical protein
VALYSTRFVNSRVAGAYVQFIVPPFKLAVIRCVTAASYAAGTVQFVCEANGYRIAGGPVPAETVKTYEGLRCVVYPNESIKVYCGATGLEVTCSGYLFDHPANTGPPAMKLAEGEPRGFPESKPSPG